MDQDHNQSLILIETLFPEFYSLSPLQKQVVHAMARDQNPLVSVWPGSDFTLAEVQAAMRDITLLCGTDDRAGILNYLYGDIDEERLSPWKESLTPDEFLIVKNTLKGLSEKDIEQITGLKLREQKKIREGILDKIGADSMEGVFALAHGVRLLDPPIDEAKEIHQNGLRALIGNGLEP